MLGEVPGGNQAAKGRAVGEGGGEKVILLRERGPWCSLPFNGYWSWPGTKTYLKPGLGSWNQVSCGIISFCFRGTQAAKLYNRY